MAAHFTATSSTFYSLAGPVLMMLVLHLVSASPIEIYPIAFQAGVANSNDLLAEREKKAATSLT